MLSFVPHPDRMASEMVRVVRGGGTVAFCMWEVNGLALVRTFWDAALRFDPQAPEPSGPFALGAEVVAVRARADA